jgi:hypothetical protein
MPNGHNRDWIRVCGAVDGFFSTFGRWPTHVEMPSDDCDALERSFEPRDWHVLNSKLRIVRAENSLIVAGDGAGNSYSYGELGFPAVSPVPDAPTWLGVWPKPD